MTPLISSYFILTHPFYLHQLISPLYRTKLKRNVNNFLIYYSFEEKGSQYIYIYTYTYFLK